MMVFISAVLRLPATLRTARFKQSDKRISPVARKKRLIMTGRIITPIVPKHNISASRSQTAGRVTQKSSYSQGSSRRQKVQPSQCSTLTSVVQLITQCLFKIGFQKTARWWGLLLSTPHPPSITPSVPSTIFSFPLILLPRRKPV